MRVSKILLIGICAVLLAGCDELGMTVSLHPITKEEQPQFEPALLGRWQALDTDDLLLFEQGVTGEYRMLVFKRSLLDANPSASPEERYTVQAVRLGLYVFLDLTAPTGTDRELLSLPVHLFARLELADNEFELAALSDAWLKTALLEKRVDVPHEMLGKQVVLTAPPKSLQQFLEHNAWDNEAFRPDGRYRRLAVK